MKTTYIHLLQTMLARVTRAFIDPAGMDTGALQELQREASEIVASNEDVTTHELEESGAHTSSPWRVEEESDADAEGFAEKPVMIVSADGLTNIAEVCAGLSSDETNANARRIVAAVNLLEGIPTWAIEQAAQVMVLAPDGGRALGLFGRSLFDSEPSEEAVLAAVARRAMDERAREAVRREFITDGTVEIEPGAHVDYSDAGDCAWVAARIYVHADEYQNAAAIADPF